MIYFYKIRKNLYKKKVSHIILFITILFCLFLYSAGLLYWRQEWIDISFITIPISMVVNFYIFFIKNKKITLYSKILFSFTGFFLFKFFIEEMIKIGDTTSLFTGASTKNLILSSIGLLIFVLITSTVKDKKKKPSLEKNYLKFRSGITFKFNINEKVINIFEKHKILIEDEFHKLKINPNVIKWESCFIDGEILCVVNKDNQVFAEYEELEKNKWFLFLKK